MDITTRTIPVVRLPLRQFAIVALLVALLAAALAVYVGSQRRVPAPFGPARNGLIPYVSNGDIYVGDPVTGTTRLLVSAPRGAGSSSPGFSPDGTRMAYLRDLPAAPAIHPLPVDLFVAHDGRHRPHSHHLVATRAGGMGHVDARRSLPGRHPSRR
jgi:hypothetical protein